MSVVIITKNEQERLPRLLRSIVSQDYKDYEIIVSDAHSTDRTRQIAKRFGCRVVDGGLPSAGRNRGAAAAKGKLLLFLDADSMLSHAFLRDSVSEFDKRGLACATAPYAPISLRVADKAIMAFANSWCRGMQYLMPNCSGVCVFCRRDDWKAVGGFPEEFLLNEDHEFVKRVARKQGKFRVLHSRPVYVDMRRFEKEGRLHVIAKYMKISAGYLLKNDKSKPTQDYVLHGETRSVTELYKERASGGS